MKSAADPSGGVHVRDVMAGVPPTAKSIVHPVPVDAVVRLVKAGAARYAAAKHDIDFVDDVPPQQLVCRDLIEQLVALGWRERVDIDAALDAVTQPRSARQLAQVLSAELALRRSDWKRAAVAARKAMAGDQNDLQAQRILSAALAKRPLPARIEPDPELKDRFCPKPFSEVETRSEGTVHTCCSAWLPLPIGRIEDQDGNAVWNSPAAQAIRRSIQDGDYRFCSRFNCPFIVGKTLPKRDEMKWPRLKRIVEQRQIVLDRGPRRVKLSHDRSCNLSCPSCRTQMIVLRKAEQDALNDMAERVVFPLLREAEIVKVTGSGDPFGSGHFRYILKRLNRAEFPNLKIELQTNGVLLDERTWRDLDLWGMVSSVWVSIDAAREETYRVVRRGGDFERLLDNLRFLGELRRQGEFRTLRVDFVVQQRNYREMGDAVDLARSVGANELSFQMIRNWGTFAVDEFARHDVSAPTHPEHVAFMAALADPRLAEKGIDLGNLTALHARATAMARALTDA